MRLVLDTAIMVAVIRSHHGASNRILTACFQKRAQILVSVPLMMEYEAVMSRTEHLKASGLTQPDIAALLDELATVLIPVELAFLGRPNLPDADDDMVLETAANGAADALVTFNKRDFAAIAPKFGIAVLSPGEALRRMELVK
ncbi:MAG TPA: putative toxin-antitoxin system toxin component, PIN family [Rhizomicrobium sp.]|jgi:putative PIN family toxin of toxin-antitoxin system|nr:putative toxin-antitoxin system toxin component, PIN family [Rhizomicrobium sp.]